MTKWSKSKRESYFGGGENYVVVGEFDFNFIKRTGAPLC